MAPLETGGGFIAVLKELGRPAADWDARVDRCKTHHHCVVIDGDGSRMLSRRVVNDEPELPALSET